MKTDTPYTLNGEESSNHLFACTDCGMGISVHARTCPYCGAEYEQPALAFGKDILFYTAWSLIALAVMLVAARALAWI